jgi:hypothetical protein
LWRWRPASCGAIVEGIKCNWTLLKYGLFGGAYRKKTQLSVNYWFIEGGHTPEDYARHARETVAKGFTSLKVDPFAHVSYWYGDDLSANGSLTETQEQRVADVRSTDEGRHRSLHEPFAIMLAALDDFTRNIVYNVTRAIEHEVFMRALEKARGEKRVHWALEEGVSAPNAFRKFTIM